MTDDLTPNEHKQEALKALDHLIARLVSGEPLIGHERFLLRASAEYAREQVQGLPVLQRVRRREAGSTTGVDAGPLETPPAAKRGDDDPDPDPNSVL